MTQQKARTRTKYHVGNLAPQLLAAAREMLEEVGPFKLSLRAVSERVGVSSAAAYHHYANRIELISHLAAQGFRELGYALQTNDASLADPSEKLRQASLTYFTFARTNPALYQLMFGPEFSNADLIPELQIARDESFGELRKIIGAILHAAPDTPEVRRAALAGWSYTHGLASLVIHGVLNFPDETSTERYVDVTLKGFEDLFKTHFQNVK
ncbi:MAG: TetR/AcrR family transcriptional regulator [Pseudomonadales bacterium]|uniref:TetR family transcriptional regulator n=1 Tax=Oleiphilus messinensis TaxID=141451 RepID=A0A1Y0II10_9GAMM|nr:TetR/AcrR family transcriptional regulator [Oleiphilus messinensis]ARU59063.1 TetR family transcriptional regulator [Oleiphilus messinensis]MCG8613956.1 TetR/AcrR family transcriptional regulator [Pseudomonadales bacterium]